jgi:hypothetical protein
MKNRGKRKALAGYVKRGKKLVSPLNALQNMKSYSYVNDLLPELLWLGLINDYSGYLRGRDVLERVVAVGKDWDLPIKNFALQSAYISLSEQQKQQVLDSWESAGLLDSMRSALCPLILLYDRCAFRFVGPPSQAIPVDKLIERLERVVGNVADKYQTPGVMLHGALLMNNLIAGRVHFSSHIDLPDFNAVVDRPDSEDARRAGSFIRASTMAQIGFLDPPKEWAQYFWNTSYDLVACDHPHDE